MNRQIISLINTFMRTSALLSKSIVSNKKMKILLLMMILSLLTIPSNSQNLMNVAFDTNGPIGECLFPEGYKVVVKTNYSADTIMGLAKEFLYSISKKYNARTSNEMEGITKLACDLELKVGKKYISVGAWRSGDIGVWEKAASTISFSLMIEIRDKKYRYTISDFETDRYRIPGEGKDRGPSNLIHWQRVNSLTKEMPKRGSKRKEYEDMIAFENALYQGEYNAVQDVIKGLENLTVNNDDF